MKLTHRLDYNRLAEALRDRGLVPQEALADALRYCSEGHMPFPEALVSGNLTTDWELAHVVCEVYGLAFLPIENVKPSPDVIEVLDKQTLAWYGIVPLGQFGKSVTLIMPGMIPADVIQFLSQKSKLDISVVVGTVRSNREWVAQNIVIEAPSPAAALPAEKEPEIEAVESSPPAHEIADLGELSADIEGGEWNNIFDVGDASVMGE